MLKKIFSYGFVEGLAKGLNKLVLLIIPLLITSTVVFGKIGLIISIETILPIITLLGLDRAVLRFYNEKSQHKNFLGSVVKPIVSFHLLIIFILSILYLVGYRYIFGINLYPDIFLLIILVFFQGINNIMLSIFRVKEQHNQYYLGRFFIQIMKFILVVTLVYLTKSYLGYVYGAILAAFSSILFTVFYNKNDLIYFYKERFDNNTFKTLFVFSWPFIFHGVANNLLGNVDKFIIEEYLTMSDVGLYTFVYTIGTSISFAYIGVTIFIEPLIYKEKNTINREKLLTKFSVIALGIGIIVFTIIGFVSEKILPYFYKGDYKSVMYMIPYVSCAYLIFPYYLKANYRLIYNGKSVYIAIISIFCALVNFGLNILFIPQYGIYAAIVITCISFVIQAGIFIYVSNGLKFKKDFISYVILSCILVTVVVLQIHYMLAALLLIIGLLYLYLFEYRKTNLKI